MARLAVRRPPYRPLFALPTLAVLLVGLGTWWLLAPHPPAAEALAGRLAASPAGVSAAALLEKGWIESALGEVYLPAPLGAPPCADGVQSVSAEFRAEARAAMAGGTAALEALHRRRNHWLSGLALGHRLVAENRLADADALFDRLLSRQGYRERIELAQIARRSGRLDGEPWNEELAALIHMLAASGALKIHRNEVGSDLWWTLRSPIALAKLYYARERRGLVHQVLDGFAVDIPSPGCPPGPPGPGSLSSHDLYNNLIVGYVRVTPFAEKAEKRQAEFARDYKDPAAENPLLAVLAARVAGLEKEARDEGRVWALSNAEKLLRDLRQQGRLPGNARLALNLAQLMEGEVAASPPEARDALLAQEAALLAQAAKGRSQVADAQRPAFDAAFTRLALLEAGRRRTAPPPVPETLRQGLASEKQQALDRALFALERRREPAAWARLVTEGADAPLRERLGKEHRPWMSALREDAAAAVARAAAGLDDPERRRLTREAGALLRAGDSTPGDLAELRRSFGWVFWAGSVLRSALGAILTALVAATFAGLFAYWLALQLRFRRELFTSFYRTEARQRLKSAR